VPHDWVYRLERLCGLTVGERAAVWRTRSIEPHADIVSAGKLSTECHIILAGFAGTCAILPDANRQIISIHVPGDFCDLHALLAGPQMEGVTALGPVTVGVVSQRALLDVAWQYPRILFAHSGTILLSTKRSTACG
jgi:CRP-like cAMP-binding protein